jgi:hypothetical protein
MRKRASPAKLRAVDKFLKAFWDGYSDRHHSEPSTAQLLQEVRRFNVGVPPNERVAEEGYFVSRWRKRHDLIKRGGEKAHSGDTGEAMEIDVDAAGSMEGAPHVQDAQAAEPSDQQLYEEDGRAAHEGDDGQGHDTALSNAAPFSTGTRVLNDNMI